MNTINPITALEKDLLAEMDRSQAGRASKLLKALDVLMARRLSDRPATIIGWRAQNFFLTEEVEAIESALVNLHRYAYPRDMNIVVGLLEARGLRVEKLAHMPRRGKIPHWSQLCTPRGRILF